MKEPYSEDLASHAGPESCICTGNGTYEALTGVHVGQVLNRENNTNFGVPTSSGRTEGNICCIVKGEIQQNPRGLRSCARMESFLRENREIPYSTLVMAPGSVS